MEDPAFVIDEKLGKLILLGSLRPKNFSTSIVDSFLEPLVTIFSAFSSKKLILREKEALFERIVTISLDSFKEFSHNFGNRNLTNERQWYLLAYERAQYINKLIPRIYIMLVISTAFPKSYFTYFSADLKSYLTSVRDQKKLYFLHCFLLDYYMNFDRFNTSSDLFCNSLASLLQIRQALKLDIPSILSKYINLSTFQHGLLSGETFKLFFESLLQVIDLNSEDNSMFVAVVNTLKKDFHNYQNMMLTISINVLTASEPTLTSISNVLSIQYEGVEEREIPRIISLISNVVLNIKIPIEDIKKTEQLLCNSYINLLTTKLCTNLVFQQILTSFSYLLKLQEEEKLLNKGKSTSTMILPGVQVILSGEDSEDHDLWGSFDEISVEEGTKPENYTFTNMESLYLLKSAIIDSVLNLVLSKSFKSLQLDLVGKICQLLRDDRNDLNKDIISVLSAIQEHVNLADKESFQFTFSLVLQIAHTPHSHLAKIELFLDELWKPIILKNQLSILFANCFIEFDCRQHQILSKCKVRIVARIILHSLSQGDRHEAISLLGGFFKELVTSSIGDVYKAKVLLELLPHIRLKMGEFDSIKMSVSESEKISPLFIARFFTQADKLVLNLILLFLNRSQHNSEYKQCVDDLANSITSFSLSSKTWQVFFSLMDTAYSPSDKVHALIRVIESVDHQSRKEYLEIYYEELVTSLSSVTQKEEFIRLKSSITCSQLLQEEPYLQTVLAPILEVHV